MFKPILLYLFRYYISIFRKKKIINSFNIVMKKETFLVPNINSKTVNQIIAYLYNLGSHLFQYLDNIIIL